MPAGTRVRISWDTHNKYPKWSETCAWAIDNFGLPGDRFTTHSTEEYLDFYFVDERDAILFQLARG